ncbi:AEC family transporter [Acinetobacter equi]|uniref:Transporter n=1 Tax=Acinetobacter equi TaxID=1324350 RepID=A0A0N9W2Z6_9GAMM|nr:AEC family transporter [Acinetobacter equi]ALH95375.1 transporter [Acinetobacter equi]
MVLAVIVPIFLLLILGYLSVKLSLLSNIQIAALGAFVIKIALPALFLQSLASKNLSEIWFPEYFGVYTTITFSLYALAFAVMYNVFKNNAAETSVLALGASMSNTGLIGTAVLTLIMGQKAMMYTSLIIIIESVLLVPFVLILAEISNQKNTNILKILKNTFFTLLKNPLFMGVILGIIFAVFKVNIPEYLDDILFLLGQTASPLALFAIGGGIVGMTLKYLNIQTCYLVFSSNILMPILVFLGLNYLTDVSKEMVYAGTIVAALPMPTIFVMLGQVYGLNQKTLTPLLLSTIIGFVVVSGLITLWWA